MSAARIMGMKNRVPTNSLKEKLSKKIIDGRNQKILNQDEKEKNIKNSDIKHNNIYNEKFEVDISLKDLEKEMK